MHNEAENGEKLPLAMTGAYCQYCPAYCCYRLPGSVLLLDHDDINRLARYFGVTDGEVRNRFLEGNNTFRTREDGSCVFLSNEQMCRRCTVHEARPRQCRVFPYGRPCPYLDSPVLLGSIQPRIEDALLGPSRVHGVPPGHHRCGRSGDDAENVRSGSSADTGPTSLPGGGDR